MDQLSPGEALLVLEELGRIAPPNFDRQRLYSEDLKKIELKTAPRVFKEVESENEPTDAGGEAETKPILLVEQPMSLGDLRLIVDDEEIPIRTLPARNVLRQGYYFSTITAIAIEEGLKPTAIPALVLGWRPDLDHQRWAPEWIKSTGIGLDLLVGGALNSLGSDSDSDVALAVGVGFTIPWSDAGALSAGVVTWREETMSDAAAGMTDQTEVALYLGISIGSFKVESKGVDS